jgi:hypothetical protein
MSHQDLGVESLPPEQAKALSDEDAADLLIEPVLPDRPMPDRPITVEEAARIAESLHKNA